MKQVKEMNKKELLDHMLALVSEVQHLYTMLQPHDTGHIHTTIGMLSSRIDDIKDCLAFDKDNQGSWNLYIVV